MNNLYKYTNIDNIILSLNNHIYSIKNVDIKFCNKTKWEVCNFHLNEEELNNYITTKIKNSTFTIKPSICIITEDTDEEYYERHKNDLEILYYGLPIWIISCGTLLVSTIIYNTGDYVRHLLVNKRIQSCKITFNVFRIKPLSD